MLPEGGHGSQEAPMTAKLRMISVLAVTTGLGAFTAAAVAAPRPAAALAAPAGAPRPAAGIATLGRQGWQVQSTAAATEWTTRSGATQPGNAISAPGFDARGWLPVTPDDAGAAGTEA